MAESEALPNDDAPEMPVAPSSEPGASHEAESERPAEESGEAVVESEGAETSEEIASEPAAWGPPWLPLALAALVPIVLYLFLPPLSRSGLWDPYELNVADLARRIALNLHGASALALEGADNSLPGLNDLGRPQLPFSSMALGFKLFGLHEWAGRVPLALWGILGVVATYGFVSRLVDKRAGLFSAVALATMPLYFVQARTMLGDIVMMAVMAMSFGGLAVAAFGARKEDARDVRIRALWFALALLALVMGFFTRGALIGVGVPAFAIGAAYVVARGSGQEFDTLSRAVGAFAVVVGVVFSLWGLKILTADHFNDMTVPLGGATVKPPTKYPSFEFMIGQLAPALAPWSAFIPFAFGRLFAAPFGAKGEAFSRESQTRLALLVGAAVVFVAHGWIATNTDYVTFAGPAILAAACGIALRDYERGAHPSGAVSVGAALLLALMYTELKNTPEKALYAFSVVSGTFPETFKAHAHGVWKIVLLGFAGVGFLTWVERDPDRKPFDPKGYLRVLIALRDTWDGMLALAYFAMVAGASLAGLAVWLGTWYHAGWLPRLSTQMHDVIVNAWWVVAFLPFVAVFGVYFWCDVWVWAFDLPRKDRAMASLPTVDRATRGFEPFEELAQRLKEGRLGETVPNLLAGKLVVTPEKLDDGIGPVALFILAPLMYLQVPAITFLVLTSKLGLRPLIAGMLAVPSGVAVFLALGVVGLLFRGSRAAFLVFAGALFGALLSGSFYPALANQLSPKEIFESYERLHKGGEPLALFGVSGRTAAYYAGGQPPILKDTAGAVNWLVSGEQGGRRFAAVRAEELARLNRAFRERTHQNLPVLDARSSQILLIASQLADGEKNQNPLGQYILSGEPKPQHKLDVNLEDKLEVLGYDILDATGKVVDKVGAGRTYRMRTYLKVRAPVTFDWDMFIHIDGQAKRHNGDHKLCDGKYPMTLWLKDDVIADEHEFKLDANFTPGGYTLWFGFYSGESSRMKVTSGASDGDNRINGGILRIQ